ncbi:MAG: hypothetical protein E6K99_05335 [Thaumarchaeota archaeon]|nr:MAG: hypothetical protein E6K99_05335 [Nitrososphaerota archaeon]
MAGINRFCVMATLQAARAHLLGLKLEEAYSWGLNKAIFYAAAKRGFKGGSGRTSELKATENRPPEARPDVFRLGDDIAFGEVRGGRMVFTIGGKVQSEAEFKRQVASRFGEKFSAAWRDALDLLRNYDRDTLLSQNAFYRDVYKPNRDSLVEKWSGLVDAQVKKEKTAGRPSRP